MKVKKSRKNISIEEHSLTLPSRKIPLLPIQELNSLSCFKSNSVEIEECNIPVIPNNCDDFHDLNGFNRFNNFNDSDAPNSSDDNIIMNEKNLLMLYISFCSPSNSKKSHQESDDDNDNPWSWEPDHTDSHLCQWNPHDNSWECGSDDDNLENQKTVAKEKPKFPQIS